ncbi:uncharacterized protein LOC142320200 [Lycorma delicatula]|uniref:uncharacterized protein LOC142320200 n=1 Tax=Lycorma delicatula TaxID=130591 RepID=UPI003F511460
MKKQILIIVVTLHSIFNVTENAPIFNFGTGQKEKPPNQKDCLKEAKELITKELSGIDKTSDDTGNTDKSLIKSALDTGNAAKSFLELCAFKCIAIFKDAAKDVISFNFTGLLNEGIKFIKCTVPCIKALLNIFVVGYGGVKDFSGSQFNAIVSKLT